MDCEQEILHWLARNNLHELSDRFQTHKICSLRRLYSLNVNLIRELIPEIGLRTDFTECWTQFKLRGTLRDGFEYTGADFTGRPSITYQNSQRVVTNTQDKPIEIVEYHSTNQGPNVGIGMVEFPVRPNLSYLQRINLGPHELPGRSISYNVPARVFANPQQKSIEVVEIDTTEGSNHSAEVYSRKPVISIHPRSVVDVPEEIPFEMILGHSSEDNNINGQVLQEKSRLSENSLQCVTNSETMNVNNDQLYLSEVQSEGTADSGWASSSSPAPKIRRSKTPPKKPARKRKSKEQPKPDTEEKRQADWKSYDLLRTMDMREYLMKFDEKSKAAVENYPSTGALTDPEQRAVCNAVAHRLMQHTIISAAEYHLAAQKICEVFPGENEVLYYCPPDVSKKKPSGKLVNKVKNIKHNKPKISNIIS